MNSKEGLKDGQFYQFENVKDKTVITQSGDLLVCDKSTKSEYATFKSIETGSGKFIISSNAQSSSSSMKVMDFPSYRNEPSVSLNIMNDRPSITQQWKSYPVAGKEGTYFIQSILDGDLLKGNGLGKAVSVVANTSAASEDNSTHWRLNKLWL